MGKDHVLSSSEKYKKDDGWCSRGLLRNYLFIFNFFFLIGGLIVLGTGIWSILAEYEFISLLSSVSYPVTSYLLATAGIIVIVASFIGCLGITKKDKCFILVYILLLLLVFLLEAKAGILAYIYREKVYGDLKVHLNDTFNNYYGFDEDKTIAIDDMHKEFKCCGALEFWQWEGSKWKNSELANGNLVPDSCCRSFSIGCGKRDHPSNIFAVGCIDKLARVVTNHLGYLAIAGLGLCVLQIFGIIFSGCLYVKLKTPDISDL